MDRLQSIYLAAKRANRYLAIEPRQAYLLKLFNESENLKGIYPDPKDENIKIYFAKASWGLIYKDILERMTLKTFVMLIDSSSVGMIFFAATPSKNLSPITVP